MRIGLHPQMDKATGQYHIGYQCAIIRVCKEGFYEENLMQQGDLIMAENPGGGGIGGREG